MEKRLEAVVRGRVQGVWFRDHTCKAAATLGVCGEVENLPDGSVRVLAEGEPEALEQLLEVIRTGPPLAQVEDVEITWTDAQGAHQSFGIV